jgi:two-component system, OmpR family, phosphate regulon sensor histidine kinase PhoR
MRRMSARSIIVIPWMVATALSLAIGHVSWGDAVIAGFFSLILAIIVSNQVTRTLRSLSQELRASSTVAENSRDMPELQDLRSTIRKLTQDAHSRAEAAAEAERRFLSVLESISEGIIQINAAGRFIHANPVAKQMLKLPADVSGQTVGAVIRHPELRRSIEQAAAGIAFASVEVAIDDRYLLVTPHRYSRDAFMEETSGAVVSVIDMTEFRRLESVRRDFVANVSHELKTPLTSIRGYAETLLADEELSIEARQQFLGIIQKNTERIQRIVDELLDLSRLQSGGWQPELLEVDPVALADDVWLGCESGHRKHITFRIDATNPIEVLADPDGLRQILTNLLDNAIRYTPEHGRITVTITPRNADADVAEIAVTDTGTGISREALPRIFERFYRADPARSRAEGGTGLGLSIVKHLVERMNGEVLAESELGKGTTIKLALPVASQR